ncbi:MAG TPA: hypothetical protein VLU73_08390 [Methylococcaceae bacterium]|nr:hypothetical protein [Methylococcaceae bacterium]
MELNLTASSESPNWQDGVDTRLLRRLMNRQVRPGLVDLTQADSITARHRNMVGAIPLADRVNRSWFEITDGKSEPSPIVYVQPRPFVPDLGKAPVASTPKTDRTALSDRKGGAAPPAKATPSVAPSVSTAKPHAAPSPFGRGLGEGDQDIALLSRQAVSPLSGVDSQTVVVQRKALEGTSPSLMPLVAPAANDGSISGSNQSPGADRPVAESVVGDRSINQGILPVVGALPIKRSVVPELNQIMPLADRTDSDRAITRANPARDAGVPVVTAIAKQRSPLFILAPEYREKPADHAMRPDDPVRVTPPAHRPNEALPRVIPSPRFQPQASAAPLPIVRESLVTETRQAALHVPGALPLAREVPRSRQQTAEPPGGSRQSRSISARAMAMESGRPRQPMNRELVSENGTRAETNRQSAPSIDIEGIVDKVERQFARRLAIESERRGKTRWR